MMKKQDLISPALMREQIVSLLPEAGKCFGDEDNLIEWGLDSLHVMRLVSLWRRAGAKVSFATLIEQPTLAAWQKLLMHCVHQDVAAPEKMDFKTTGSDGPAAVFGLTDVQHAYWIGRRDDQPLGGVGCHAYLEFDGEGIDPVRLEKAWQQVIHGHKMLRARFNDEGLQWIGADTPSARLTVHDLRTLDPVECNTELVAIRQRLSHRRLAVAQGETSGLTLSLLPGGATRIHFDIDLLVADVLSLQIVMHDLAAAYADGYGPDVPSAWHFSTYLAQEAQRKAPQMAQHRAYWTDRLSRLPGGPQLPLYTAPETIGSPEFTRRQYHLSGRQWQQLKVHAAGHRVTPAMTLISVYAEILAYWSSDKHFSLNVPLFDRQAVYPDIDKVVADFTNLLLLEVDCREKMTFEARVQAVQKQFHEDIAHADYSAVQVLRDLARQHQGERIAVPVVFACNLGAPFIDETTHSVLGKMNYMISQTPQVWLDHQVYELEEGLLLTWDSVDALFPPSATRHNVFNLHFPDRSTGFRSDMLATPPEPDASPCTAGRAGRSQPDRPPLHPALPA